MLSGITTSNVGVHGLGSAEDGIDRESSAELVHAEATVNGRVLLLFDLWGCHDELCDVWEA